MGRRSEFKRVERDYYRSIDPRIGHALAPHLSPGVRYVEPCAGAGDLIAQLRPFATCVGAYDIAPQTEGIARADMFDLTIGDADMWIANPPWARPILHRLIVHLSDQAPLWALFDANWAFTKQAGPFMPRLRRVVTVGRLKWIPDSTMVGKDDAAWFLFDRPLAGSAPIFYGRGCLPVERRRSRRLCADCGVLIDRFGKWGLVERNGVPAPVHINCRNPASRLADGEIAEPSSAPLLEWGNCGV